MARQNFFFFWPAPKSLPITGVVHVFSPVEDLALLGNGPNGCGEMARGGCSYAWNFSVTRSPLLTEAENRTRPIMTLSQH